MTDSKGAHNPPAPKTMTNIEGKYLTFFMGKEEYGIGILKVKEIIGMMPVTTVPRVPGYIKGVINLRGKIIPVIDLRVRFAMAESPCTERTCIIVVETKGQQNSILIGIIVDAVAEVVHMREADVEEAPKFGAHADTGYLLGMAKINGGVKILLDIDKVLRDEAIAAFEHAA